MLKLADYIGSTSGIIDFAAEDDGKEYIIGTESGVLYELKKQNPDKSVLYAYRKSDLHRYEADYA